VQVAQFRSVAEGNVPSAFALYQNYPNPFNPSTAIRYAIPEQGHIRLDVYSMLGKHVSTLVDEVKPAGFYTVPFNASDLASGVYLSRLSSPKGTIFNKMVLMK
jgi:hypothetical protein